MIRRIELINFMSHPHTVIEPADGLTVLVGDNNTGKSAVIAALQILSRNTSGDFMVRHGERECRIIVTTDDAHELQWCRKGRTVSYTIDGREVHRLRGSVPEDLHDLLRLAVVETEGDPFDVHFGEQKKPIFLLDESPGRRATFFASSSDAIRLIEMQGRHRRKVQDAKAREGQLVRDADRVNARLTALSPLPAMGERMDQLEKSHAAVAADANRIEALLHALLRIRQAQEHKSKWTRVAAALEPLAVPPEPVPTDPLRRLICEMDQARNRIRENTAATAAAKPLAFPPEIKETRLLVDLINRMAGIKNQATHLAAQKEAIQPLSTPPVPAETTRLSTLIRRITDGHRYIATVTARHEALKGTPSPPALADTDGLEALISQLTAAGNRVRGMAVRTRRLADLPAFPKIHDNAALRHLITQIDKSLKQVDRLAADRDAAAADLARAREALRQCILETGICPTCGQVMDPDRIMGPADKADGGMP